MPGVWTYSRAKAIADDDDEAFVPGTMAEADGEDSDGYWWWQSTEARAAK
jgi:hypothetical protein